MKIQNTFYPSNRKEWRKWLSENHSKADDVWVIYYKKHTNNPRVSYDDAVEEALCFGWIDSTVKRIDDEKYCQRFTQRNDKSEWSELNKKRIEKLIKNKKITKHGMAKVNIAKDNGMWYKKTIVNQNLEMPQEFTDKLSKNKKAHDFYYQLSPSHKKNYLAWIVSAKKDETKKRRIEKVIEMLLNSQKPGMM